MFFKKRNKEICIAGTNEDNCCLLSELKDNQHKLEILKDKINIINKRLSKYSRWENVAILLAQIYSYKQIYEDNGYDFLQDLNDYITYRNLERDIEETVRKDKEKLGIK